MQPRRRTTATVLLLVLLHMLGLGSGVLRATAAPEGCGPDAMQMMEGMPMPASERPDGHGSDESAPGRPCGLPWAVGCASAGPCLPPLVVADAPPLGKHIPRGAAILQVPATAPVAPTRVPELPPPRA